MVLNIRKPKVAEKKAKHRMEMVVRRLQRSRRLARVQAEPTFGKRREPCKWVNTRNGVGSRQSRERLALV